jgi:hypothetical protein
MADDERPPLETIKVTPAARRYLEVLDSLGILEGELRNLGIRSAVVDVLHGLHHALAGGEVTVEVARDGTPSMVQELDLLLEDAAKEKGFLDPDLDPDIVYF